jgi:hypothetical protein
VREGERELLLAPLLGCEVCHLGWEEERVEVS